MRLGKRRPGVIVSRDDPGGIRSWTTVAPVTTRVRRIRSQVVIGPAEGLPEASAVNCDDLATIRKERLVRRIGHLTQARVAEVHDALRFALQLEADR